jgi:SAM-dependent methyltransferase
MKNYLRTYLRNRPLFYSLIRPKEAELFYKELPLKRPVLDFGCGDGFFADTVFNNTCRIDVGIDVDPKKIKEAEKLGVYDTLPALKGGVSLRRMTYQSSIHPRAKAHGFLERCYKKVKLYDGKKIPYPDSNFATVISNCVFEHLDDLDRSLSEIRRVMKPKGKLITTVMTDNWEKYLFGSLLLGALYKKWMRKKQRHLNLLSSNDWQNVFKKNGFKVRKSIGYLDKKTSRRVDILHYVSAGSLISKKVFNKWVVFPEILDVLKIEDKLKRISESNCAVNKSAAIFYVLEKN